MLKGVCKNCKKDGKTCEGCYKKIHLLAVSLLTIVVFAVGAFVGMKAGYEKATWREAKMQLHAIKQQEVLVNELNKERAEANQASDAIQQIQDIIGEVVGSEVEVEIQEATTTE